MFMPYLAAIYSQQGCEYCRPFEIDNNLSRLNYVSDVLPCANELESIKDSLIAPRTGKDTRLLVLVPDSWLSVSSHFSDEPIPSKLLPLASLSHAVEVTFSAPETVWFGFQYQKVTQHSFELRVVACSAELAQSLLSPFLSHYKACLLMTYGQWQALKAREKSWTWLVKKSLSHYQFGKKERQKTKTLWLTLLLSSAFVHLGGYVYWQALTELSDDALLESHTLHHKASDWMSSSLENRFLSTSLTLFQGLSTSAFPLVIKVNGNDAMLQLMVPENDLVTLQKNWQEQHPDWRIDLSPHNKEARASLEIFSHSINKAEVWDVSISNHQD
ncbi:hypothetical protein OFY17_14040 [Marinomonas sp. C2222]|uniref:GspL cytoplasmic actin-ATPase-like region n=1 Tax=Marinomonas sargassi TaxID=2984494 RepID=A0ABT2YVS2_9GAMM|nr:hypothetical protein [Marinomonas sargassi]MCV2403986.1 hypothetical protein [Marinomonas sargassi]